MGNPTNYSTLQVELVHPTGAGDVFAASLLSSLHALNGDYCAATQVAARLAAISVTRFGLESAPTAAEVQASLSERGKTCASLIAFCIMATSSP